MDSGILNNAIGGLDQLLSQARRALFEISQDMYPGGGDYDNQGRYPDAKEVLSEILKQLYSVLLVVLEAAQLPEARISLKDAWPRFVKGGLTTARYHPDYDMCFSDAFTFLEHMIDALRLTITGSITSEQAWTLNRLETMLRDTAGLLQQRGVVPRDELELQKVMHDYLSACFPDFRQNPQIGGTIKNFIPDCGIPSVGVAIEFKIAHTKPKAVQAFTGIVEDVGGYNGSKDWTRFYAVMYQAKAFIRESQLQSDMKRIKAATWKAILVNGDTNPKAGSLRTPGKKRSVKLQPAKNTQNTGV